MLPMIDLSRVQTTVCRRLGRRLAVLQRHQGYLGPKAGTVLLAFLAHLDGSQEHASQSLHPSLVFGGHFRLPAQRIELPLKRGDTRLQCVDF